MNNLPEKILKIETVDGVDSTGKPGNPDTWSGKYDGYKIITDKQEILLLISNDQQCCESWGYFESNDNTDDFIGANLLELKLVDDALDEKIVKDKFEYSLDEGDIQFVNFETDKGTLQLAVYNAHNGYYGHNILLKSNQLTKESSL